MASHDEFHQATERGTFRRKSEPHAVKAVYDGHRERLVVTLNNGTEVAFPISSIEGLAGAQAADLAEIEIEPFGFGLHWPRLDADVYLPGLLNGVFGSQKWVAATLGKAGGQVKTPKKALAARLNGKKGGRPRKAAVASRKVRA